MREQFIIVSLPRGYGAYQDFLALCSDGKFNSYLTFAMRFNSKEEAKAHLSKIAEERKKNGFYGTFVLWELLF